MNNIYLKNIIKKNNAKRYLITITVIAFLSYAFLVLNAYLTIYLYELNNTQEKRSILIESVLDCNAIDNKYIEDCKISEDGTIIIVDNVNNVLQVAGEYKEEYDIIIYDNANEDMGYIISFIKIISILIFISCIIIVIITIIQFNKDDYEINKILRAIGYSKEKLFLINSKILITIISTIYLLPLIITPILIIFFKNIDIKNVIIIYIVQYITILLIILISYKLSYLKMNKRKIR